MSQLPYNQNNNNDMYRQSSQVYGAYGLSQQQQNVPLYNQQNGFVNRQPRTREERELQREQEKQQQAQVIQRLQFTPGNSGTKYLLQPDQNTSLFLPDHQRFQKDFAAEDKIFREQQRRQKEMNYEIRRIGHLEREALTWQRNEDVIKKDEQKRQYHEEQYNNGKRNANGLAYNPLTLQYANTEQGQQLKRRDDLSQVRAMVRAQNLDQRSNCGYNLLTGEQRVGVETIVPVHLQQEYQTKVREKDNYYDIKYYAKQAQEYDTGTKTY